MKTLLSTLALTTAIAIPGAVAAKPVSFTINMKNYGGPGAYLALYVIDANGPIRARFGWLAVNRNTTAILPVGIAPPGAI